MADLGFAAKTRPVIVVSRHDPDLPRALVVYVPITSQNRQSSYEITLPRLRFLKWGSVANVQGIASLPTIRLGRKLGDLPTEAMKEIKRAIVWALELDEP